MGVDNFFIFLAAAIVFVITPGMDTLFVLNKSLSGGRKSGLFAGLGVNTGVLVHTFLGAAGITLIIAQSPTAFGIIKYFGAAYIFYMGFTGLRKSEALKVSESSYSEERAGRSYWSGFLTNTLNPKVAIFFMAFFPQFINANHLHSPFPFIVLGITYAIIGLVWLLLLAFAAGRFAEKIKSNPSYSIKVGRISSVLFILMGLGVAFM